MKTRLISIGAGGLICVAANWAPHAADLSTPKSGAEVFTPRAVLEANAALLHPAALDEDAPRSTNKEQKGSSLKLQVTPINPLTVDAAQAGSTSVQLEAQSSRKRATANRLASLVSRGNRAEGVLVLHARKPTPAEHAEKEQDMRIMAHLLEKVLDQTGEDAERKAMGIALAFSSKSARHFFLEGYGAVFTFNVQFPLAPNEPDVTSTQMPAATRSDWEKARRDLYGRRRGNNLSTEQETEPRRYDRAAVERLQQSFLTALKHGHHIRHLKAEDKVVVILSQASLSSDVLSWKLEEVLRSSSPGGESRVVSRQKQGDDSMTDDGSTLQISVRKGDIDALAKGQMTFEDFRGKASIFAY